MILDAEWRLVWASDELLEFIRAEEGLDIGYGRHIAEALVDDPWLSSISPDSFEAFFADVGPYLLEDFNKRGLTPEEILPAELARLLESTEPATPPEVFHTRFRAADRLDPKLSPYPVDVCAIQVRDDNATFVGWIAIMFMGIRPNLLALLARGDEEMFERMARLVEPRARQGALLFCDLHNSGKLSRQLPSINYFRLVRTLWTGIDQAVADNLGVIGKHAGDGASAYFLVDDLGSPSGAATAAMKTAARIHEFSREVFSEVTGTDCPMRIGLHWGGSLYMGQLMPGSRLDVTALGDEVNEAARIQEAAGPGDTIVSKQLLEQISPDDAVGIDIQLEQISYRLLGELAPDAPKVVRDAGGIAVTTL
jgi:class 3 adenylate cyclase